VKAFRACTALVCLFGLLATTGCMGAEVAVIAITAAPTVAVLEGIGAVRKVVKRYEDAGQAQDIYEERMKSCPPGYEALCRSYYHGRLLSEFSDLPLSLKSSTDNVYDTAKYGMLVDHLKAGDIPADEAGLNLVRRMARCNLPETKEGGYRSRDIPVVDLERVKNDVAPWLAPDADAPARSVALVLFRKAFESRAWTLWILGPHKVDVTELDGTCYRTPYENRAWAAQAADALLRLIGAYEADAPKGTPSFGLATMYEAYAWTLDDPADSTERRRWRDKALAEYAACAKAAETDGDASRALYAYCVLARDEAAGLALLKAVDAAVTKRGRRLEHGRHAPDRIEPLWHSPVNVRFANITRTGTPEDKRDLSVMQAFLPLFADMRTRIDAVYYVLKLFSLEYEPSRDTYGILPGEWRTIAYRFALDAGSPNTRPNTRPDTRPDTRWFAMVNRLLADHPSYAIHRLLYEAEQALLLGDRAKAEKLVRAYRAALPSRYEYKAGPLPSPSWGDDSEETLAEVSGTLRALYKTLR
jgi:hypothetical protein